MAKWSDTLALLKIRLFGLTDRKSTRLNSSHDQISYAVFCLKKKKNGHEQRRAQAVTASPHHRDEPLGRRRDRLILRTPPCRRPHTPDRCRVALDRPESVRSSPAIASLRR